MIKWKRFGLGAGYDAIAKLNLITAYAIFSLSEFYVGVCVLGDEIMALDS